MDIIYNPKQIKTLIIITKEHIITLKHIKGIFF